jgi:hypothetical protein
MALLGVVVLVSGVALGSVLTTVASRNQPSASATSAPTAAPTLAGLPTADVSGEDFDRLLRYPGSVRTEFEVSRDQRFLLIAVEYFADASLEEVRQFYQGSINEHGWQVADITYTAGEWTYLLVDGATEALVEIEVTRGYVEIDLQVSSPTESPTPQPTPMPTASPAPPAPPPPPPGDDDGDDDDDETDDDDGGDSDD